MSAQRNIHKVEVLEYPFEWKIENFSLIGQNENFINSQKTEFEAEIDGIPNPLKWKFYLKKNENWISLWASLLNCPDAWREENNGGAGVYVAVSSWKCFLNLTTADGATEIPESTQPISAYCSPKSRGWKEWMDLESLSKNLDENGALCITIATKLILTSAHQSTRPASKALDLFHKTSSPKAKQAMVNALLKSSIPSTNVPMISKDKKEYLAQWSVLAERSPVFARMYEANMKERETGIIEVKNMSGKTLKVFHYFIYYGELPPEWKEDDVIVELVNAASMYEFQDLLQFMDGVLESVCSGATVVQLLSLSRKMSLKKAEEGLLDWIKKHGVNSADGFFSMLEPFVALVNSQSE